MILFTVLAIILAILLVFTVFVLSVGGAVGIIIFGDIFVCILFIVLIMKKLIKK